MVAECELVEHVLIRTESTWRTAVSNGHVTHVVHSPCYTHDEMMFTDGVDLTKFCSVNIHIY